MLRTGLRTCAIHILAASADRIVPTETCCSINTAGASNAENSVFLRRIQTAHNLALTVRCTAAFSVPCSNRARKVEVFFADVYHMSELEVHVHEHQLDHLVVIQHNADEGVISLLRRKGPLNNTESRQYSRQRRPDLAQGLQSGPKERPSAHMSHAGAKLARTSTTKRCSVLGCGSSRIDFNTNLM